MLRDTTVHVQNSASVCLSNRAPAKVVLWGEYAVLAGATAAVAAIDRYTEVSLKTGSSGFQVSTSGLVAPSLFSATRNFTGADAASLIEAVLSHWGYEKYPDHINLHIDSSRFYDKGAKLGLGSSAATCVAIYRLLAEHLGHPTDLAEVTQIHHAWQGNRGSGIDVAASYLGSTHLFNSGNCTPLSWPAQLQFRIVWTGASASTTTSVTQFSQWRERKDANALDELVCASNKLSDKLNHDNLHAYIDALAALDRAANLNIYTPAHKTLATIAKQADIFYKPCGAGGGDIGIAISDDPHALSTFSAQATEQNFLVIQSEIAPHGVEAGA